jgi:type VI secretion system protein ImpK
VRQEGAAVNDDDALGSDGHTVFQPTPLQQARARLAETRAAPPPADEDFPEPPVAARAHNPIVAAAAPLLALIASARSGRIALDLPSLHRRASAAAQRFDAAIAGGGYDAETQRRARYAFYATVDDIAQNLPGQAADGAEWARRSMVVRGFGENIGGDRFWALLREMLAQPAAHAELIELYHACLAAGFEGRYRVAQDERGQRAAILASAYAAIPAARGLSETELVPHWRGEPTARGRIGFWAPIGLAASVVLGVLLLVVLAFRLVLIQTGQPAMTALLALNPEQPLRLSRAAAPVAAPVGPQQQRLQGFLADEIARKLVVVEQDPNSVRVRTTVGTLFRSGSDQLAPGRQALFEKIAEVVAGEKGLVRVEGHADSDPVASLTFPDNVALSKARAETVAAILRARLADPARVQAQGFGATQPIAPNATPDGKAQNRRVEIVIARNG